jgi:hypothetical protein
MNGSEQSFISGAVRPVECLREGWQLIKGSYWLFLGISVVGSFLGGLAPLGILLGPCMCGIYLCYFRQMQRREVKFDMLFEGFNYFIQSLIAALIMMVPILILVGCFYIALFIAFLSSIPPQGPNAPPPGPPPAIFFTVVGVGAIILMIGSFIVHALFLFVFPLIVDRKLTGLQAVQTSFKAVFANLGGVAGLVILNGLIAILGLLACYVGAIFVIPITMAAQAVAYRAVFPLDDLAAPQHV